MPVAFRNVTPHRAGLLKEIAHQLPVARLIARIDATRGASGLSSAVRVWVLQHYREGARRGGRA